LSDPGSGILLLDKPVGLTSNAALGRAKRVLGIRKAGHAGTLDPMASGLLVLCFGEATKVSGFLLDAAKAYSAEATLGIVTDSEDAEGQVIAEHPVPELDRDRIGQVLKRFRGDIEQIPPMYSALKQGGKRLYTLARKGETVERPPRPVTIHRLELTGLDLPRLTLEVDCSKGTYIRSLVRDIGAALGCGAHLSALRRTLSAPFKLTDAIALGDLESLNPQEARTLLLPPDQALTHLPEIHLDPIQSTRIRHGQRLAGLDSSASGLVRVYDNQTFIGIGESDGQGHLKPRRLMAGSSGNPSGQLQDGPRVADQEPEP
jgi:tRNA pseudouridine55 synthase